MLGRVGGAVCTGHLCCLPGTGLDGDGRRQTAGGVADNVKRRFGKRLSLRVRAARQGQGQESIDLLKNKARCAILLARPDLVVTAQSFWQSLLREPRPELRSHHALRRGALAAPSSFLGSVSCSVIQPNSPRTLQLLFN